MFPSMVDEKIEPVLNEATARGYGRMYSLTPVKTGALRASLFAKVISKVLHSFLLRASYNAWQISFSTFRDEFSDGRVCKKYLDSG